MVQHRNAVCESRSAGLKALGLGALALALAGIAPSAAKAQAAGDLITSAKLGAVYALSGPLAIYSPPAKNGIELALADLNAKGDLKLDITLEDDRSTKDDVINVYQKFIQRDNALAIFGPMSGGQAFAAGPLAQQAKVPVMLTTVATPGITGIGDYVFRTSVESAMIIPGTVKKAKETLGMTRVAVLYANDDQFSVGEFKAFETALKATPGVQVLTIETVRTGDVDFSAQLTKIKGLNPDTLVICTQGQEAVGVMTQARKLGLEKVHFLGGNSFNSAGVVKESGKAMEGALSATPWFISMSHPKNVEFVKKYREKFGVDPDWLAAQSYDGVSLVKQALLDAKILKTDNAATARTKLRNALAAIKTYDGVLGQITFTPGRDPILAGAIIKVENGKHVLAQ
jgi:branched-chain amino acid transport system substrate-binding protein